MNTFVCFVVLQVTLCSTLLCVCFSFFFSLLQFFGVRVFAACQRRLKLASLQYSNHLFFILTPTSIPTTASFYPRSIYAIHSMLSSGYVTPWRYVLLDVSCELALLAPICEPPVNCPPPPPLHFLPVSRFSAVFLHV